MKICVSLSGHDPAFGSYSDVICDSVGDMYAGSGQWACLGTDNFLDESVSSTTSFPMVRIFFKNILAVQSLSSCLVLKTETDLSYICFTVY